MINESIYQNFKLFIENSIITLKFEIDTFMKIRKEYINYHSRDSFFDRTDTIYFKKSDFLFLSRFVEYLVYSKTDILMSIGEYSKVVTAIKSDKKFNQIFKHKGIHIINLFIPFGYDVFLFYYLEKAIVYYILNESIDEEEINKYYQVIQNFAYNGITKINKMSPLKGFYVDDDSISLISLTDTVSIRKVTKEEKTVLYEKGISEDIFSPEIQWVIEHSIPVDNQLIELGYIDHHPKFHDSTDIIFYAAITLLRLFQEGRIGLNSIITIIDNRLPFKPVPLIGLEINGMDTEHPNYVLKRENISKLKEFWIKYGEILIETYPYKIEKKDKFKNIKNALERFNFANQHELGEQSVLDFVIGLEALLTGKWDGVGEVAYRVSRRYAKLVGRDPADRIEVFNRIKTYYNFRSRLAHGDRNISGFNLIDMHMDIGICIVKYLDLIKHRSHEQILEILDYS